MDKYDEMNTLRIAEGLNSMTETLNALPPEKRNIRSTDEAGMYGLFEALSCIQFLRNEESLQRYFDRPFQLVQTNKTVKLPKFVPGMVCFLFSHNKERFVWAAKTFSTIKYPLTGKDFEYSVQPFLEEALSRVDILALEKDFLPRFWHGTAIILTQLPKNLVPSHLRAMQRNLYTTGLEHLQIPGTHLWDELRCFQKLLELSSNDFWEAMNPVTAQSVIENIFVSPTLQDILKTTVEKEPLQLEEKMEWTVKMMKSIDPKTVVKPLRIMLDQLMQHFQKPPYSKYAQSVCWQKGLMCLDNSLRAMMARVQDGPTVALMLQLITSGHLEAIMQELDGIEKKDEMQIEQNEQLCLDVIQHALGLDLASLASDKHRAKEFDAQLRSDNLELWKKFTRGIKTGRPHIPACILSALKTSLSLEPIDPRHVETAPKEAKAWNSAAEQVLGYVCTDLLERLDSFHPDQLVDLLQDPNATQGLMTLLCSSEAKIHSAALSVLKDLSGEDTRRGSLMHLIKVFDTTAMPSLCRTLDTVIRHRYYTPCSMSLKICTDVFECLCDSHDGILRTQKLSQQQLTEIERFWQKIWQLLGMIFETTEDWSQLGYNKQTMQEFCRETMDFADTAFDQYSVIASTLQDISGRIDTDIKKMLLEFPRAQFVNISKWLRLRDQYLITKAVSLTGKILGRLHEVGIRISSDAEEKIENIVTKTDKSTKVKTLLSAQQKAELRRSLEHHTGTRLKGEDEALLEQPAKSIPVNARMQSVAIKSEKSAKPGSIDLEQWSDAARRRREIHATEDAELKKLQSSMGGTEAFRRQMQQQKAKGGVGPITAKAAQKQQDDQKNFLLKRQKEKEEAEKRRLNALKKAAGPVAGSGVSGLGDIGKDHSMKGQNVMVSSGEESSDEDDDDDDMDADLFGGQKKTKKIERPDVNPNGAIGLRAEQKAGPTRIQRTQRSKKDMRARLAPDLTNLHRTILKWDFFHDGDYPPGSMEFQFKAVPNSFTDPVTYKQTFEPLLILEAWQGMVKAREENASKPYEVKIQNRSNVDQFIEVSSLLGHQENRELQVQEGDIILLSRARTPTEDSESPHCLARVYRVKRQKQHLEVVYQVVSGSSLAPSLTQQSVVYGVKVQTITPLEREYGSLQALEYYDLCTQVIKARPSKRLHFSERQITNYQDVWDVNRAQSEAINAALENEGFSLIQGPPGSGKTKTIVAIVGGLLTQALNSSSTGTKISVPKQNGTGGAGFGNDAPSKKLLVCAPSNAAVDELVMRLKSGVKTKGGKHHQLNVVRIGRSEAINAQVVDVTMDELVAKKIGRNTGDEQKQRERNAELFTEHGKISGLLKELYGKKDSGEIKDKALSELEAQIVAIRKKKQELGARIDNAKDSERNAGREAELNRKKAQQAVLDEAHVICATLSGSGHDMFQSLNIDLETVIIDEAAQCVEMSSLIPLKYGCVKCIMVGDPKQLPPTVFSKEAAKFQYEQSLFVRMQNNWPGEVHLLDTQYRMHPQISAFPSQAFYDGLLKDGQGMAGLRQRPWHASSILAPYRFFDVTGQHQAAPKGHSLINLAEIDIALALYERLIADFRDYDFNNRIGIITPYKSQLRALKERFSRQYGKGITETIEFNTTDAFQGRESEIIIFSCVRASPSGGIGFLQDIRRMNVGLTRAKSSLWVLGNSESLVRGQFWRKLVEDAKARDCYSSGDLKRLLNKPSSAHPAANIGTLSIVDSRTHVSPVNGTGANVSHASTNGSSRQSAPDAKHFDETRSSSDTDRMEDIKSASTDSAEEVNKPAQAIARPAATDITTNEKPSRVAEPQDIDMTYDGSVDSRSVTASDTGSRAGTPSEYQPADSTGRPRPGKMVSAVPQVLKKRPAASPFMPRKQPKPKR